MSPTGLLSTLHPVSGVVLIACLLSAAAAAPPLTLWNAVEITHPTETGKIYTVEGSDNLKIWNPLHSPVYGDGGETRRILSTRTVPVDYQFYHLKVETASDAGFAPWSLEGRSFRRCAAGNLVKYSFAAGGGAVVTPEGGSPASAQWTWLRTGPNTGRATLRRAGDVDEVLELTYVASGVGQAVRELRGSWGVIGREAGSFGPAVTAGQSNLPVPAGEGLEGFTLAVSDSSGVLGLCFSGPGRGALISPAGVSAFTSAWVGIKDYGEVSVTISPDRQENYKLTFKGPSAGTFVRKLYVADVLRDVDTGSFSFGPS